MLIYRGHSNIDLNLSELDLSSLSNVLLELKEDANLDDYKILDADVSSNNELERIESIIIDAKEHLESVKSFEKTPITLGKLFMDKNFPFDTDDNRYTLCGYCGFGGEMICCEKCALVSHLRCANLNEVPETDWFCHFCTEASSSSTSICIEIINKKHDEMDKKLQEIKSRRIGNTLTSERNDCDDEIENDNSDESVVDFWNDDKERRSTRSATRQAAEIKVQSKTTTQKNKRQITTVLDKVVKIKRGRGRPPRQVSQAPVQSPFKQKKGRPRKLDSSPVINKEVARAKIPVKRKRGRPPTKKLIMFNQYEQPSSPASPKMKRKQKQYDEKLKETSSKNRVPTHEWCPSGWTKTRVQRLKGISAGAWDNLWISPDGRRFRSRTVVESMVHDEEEKEKANAALESIK